MTWPLVKLSNGIAEVVRGVTFSQQDSIRESREGYLPVLRAGNIAEELNTKSDLVWVPEAYVSAKQMLRRNDIVMCTSSGSPAIVGKAAIAENDFYGSWGAFNAVIRATNKIAPSFLYFWTQSSQFRSWRDRAAKGANIQNIRHSDLSGLEVPLPPPSEQHRIVELLARANALRRLRRAADAKAARILPALFLKMFGDPASNPMGWTVKPFDDAFRDTTAGNGKLQSKQFQKSGAVAVIDQGQSKIAGYTDDESLLYKGDLPVVIFGDHTRIFKFVDHPFVLGADGVRVLTSKEGFTPLFAYWHCQMLDIPSAGYSRHFKFLKEKPFICPDAALQKRYTVIAEGLMAQLSALDNAAREIEHLFSAMLHKAFSGNLTAKWRQVHMQELLAEMQQQAEALNLPMPKDLAA